VSKCKKGRGGGASLFVYWFGDATHHRPALCQPLVAHVRTAGPDLTKLAGCGSLFNDP
jgi:hypothetical protein